MSSVIPVFANNYVVQSTTVQPKQQQQIQQQQQCTHNNNHHKNDHKNNQRNDYERKKVMFDPISISYAELYSSLIVKNMFQPKSPPHMPEPLPWWHKPDQHCAYHQGAPGHDIENCYSLKYEVQRLVRSGMMSFEDHAPNVKANSLPAHGNSSVSMVDGCPCKTPILTLRSLMAS